MHDSHEQKKQVGHRAKTKVKGKSNEYKNETLASRRCVWALR